MTFSEKRNLVGVRAAVLGLNPRSVAPQPGDLDASTPAPPTPSFIFGRWEAGAALAPGEAKRVRLTCECKSPQPGPGHGAAT